jgi:hypothetical protein
MQATRRLLAAGAILCGIPLALLFATANAAEDSPLPIGIHFKVRDQATGGCWATPTRFHLEAKNLLNSNGYRAFDGWVALFTAVADGEVQFSESGARNYLEAFVLAEKSKNGKCYGAWVLASYGVVDMGAFINQSGAETTATVTNSLLEAIAKYIEQHRPKK